MSAFRVLVTGGRAFTDADSVFRELNALKEAYGRIVVIQGGASGADHMARQWCFTQPSCHLINEPADWGRHGRAAGPIRNKKMLDDHKPDLVLAFDGGRGTANMVRQAEQAGVPVRRVPAPAKKEG